MTSLKPIELNYFPTRNGGPDQLHDHTSYRPTASERENCGACAQLENDFTWLRFNDAMGERASEFGTVEDAILDAMVNVNSKAGKSYVTRRESPAAAVA